MAKIRTYQADDLNAAGARVQTTAEELDISLDCLDAVLFDADATSCYPKEHSEALIQECHTVMQQCTDLTRYVQSLRRVVELIHRQATSGLIGKVEI